MLVDEIATDQASADDRASNDGVLVTASSWKQFLGLHILGLAAVLSLCAVLIGPGSFTVDERAYNLQAEIVRNGEGIGDAGWGIAYPDTPFDATELGAPLANAVRTSDAWFAYAAHPFYIEVLAVSQRIAGQSGPMILSLVSVVLAAAAMERIARRHFSAPKNLVFWFVGLASPLAFHGFVAWAHAPVAALVALALAFGLPSSTVRPEASAIERLAPIVVFGSAFVAAMLRTEAPIAAIGLAIVFVLGIERTHRLWMRGVVNAIAVLGGSALGVMVDDRWSSGITGNVFGYSNESTQFDVVANATGILLNAGREPISVLRLIGVGLLVIAALWLKKDARLASIIAVFAGVCGIAGSTATSSYNGFVAPAAAVVVGLVLWAQAGKRLRLESAMVAASGVVVVGAIIASPWGGGGAGWGGRYALLAVLFAAPVAISALATAWRESNEGRLLGIVVIAVTIATQVSGVNTLMITHDSSEIVSAQLDTALPDLADRVDVIVSSDPRLGRLSPRTAMVLPIVSLVTDDEIQDVLDAELARTEASVDRIAVVGVVQPIEFEPDERWVIADQGNDRSLQFLILERTP